MKNNLTFCKKKKKKTPKVGEYVAQTTYEQILSLWLYSI